MRAAGLTVLIFSMLFGSAFFTAAEAKKRTKPNEKYASIVMDADTGLILSQRHADKVLHPASLTKMMTLMMAFDALDRGDIQLRERIRISKHAASMVPSKLGLPAGSTIRVQDAILALVTKSANDVAVALAEHLGGTESRFALNMTKRARNIGMTRTRFRNASGLHDSKQVTTARDMAKLSRYLILRYPHYYRYFSTKKFTYRGKTYRNHNRLMDSYAGMDGLKTGYIRASGFNLAASAVRHDRRLIGVVFGGRTSKTRNAHMAEILDKGFKKVKTIRIAKTVHAPLPDRKPRMLSDAGKTGESFTSLASLESGRQLRVSQQQNQNSVPAKSSLNYTKLTEALQSGAFGEMTGEGDIDPALSKRIETGLLAIAVHQGRQLPRPRPVMAVKGAATTPEALNRASPQAGAQIIHPGQNNNWEIQIGAFNSRVRTDEKLRYALASLPGTLRKETSPLIVPLRTAEGMIYRARLGGLSQASALKACKYFQDCIPIAPRNH